jgi:hypothetical protein
MDDLQFWLYVIIGVIYLLTQIRKKARQSQDSPTPKPVSHKRSAPESTWHSEPTAPPTTKKPVSFEDLLREITEAKSLKAEPEYDMEEVDFEYDDEPVEDHRVRDVVDHRKPEYTYDQYEAAKAHDYSKDSLEESLKLENVDMGYGKFREFETAKPVNLLDLYTKDLRDPEGLKKAVILTEVLSPRHF